MSDDLSQKGIQDRTRINTMRTTRYGTGPRNLAFRKIG
jgi:hypothetical protein